MLFHRNKVIPNLRVQGYYEASLTDLETTELVEDGVAELHQLAHRRPLGSHALRARLAGLVLQRLLRDYLLHIDVLDGSKEVLWMVSSLDCLSRSPLKRTSPW